MTAGNFAKQKLRQAVARLLRLNKEIAELNADKSQIYKDSKGKGLDPKQIRKVIASMKVTPAVRAEQDDIFQLYMDAIEERPLTDDDAAPIEGQDIPVQPPRPRTPPPTPISPELQADLERAEASWSASPDAPSMAQPPAFNLPLTSEEYERYQGTRHSFMRMGIAQVIPRLAPGAVVDLHDENGYGVTIAVLEDGKRVVESSRASPPIEEEPVMPDLTLSTPTVNAGAAVRHALGDTDGETAAGKDRLF